MLKISLNSEILNWNIMNSAYLDKRYSSWRRHLVNQCLFLTQDKDVLAYTSMNNDSAAIHVTEKVDFELPYPLVINTWGLRFDKKANLHTRRDLTIPKCTMANLIAYHDPLRPEWIRPKDDLKTNIIMVGDRRTNLEYIKNKSLSTFFNEVMENPINDWRNWDWNIDCDDSNKFGSNFKIPARVLHGYSQFEYGLMDSAKCGIKKYTEYSDSYEIGEDRETSDRNLYYDVPIAVWRPDFKDFNINAQIAVIGRPKER